MHEYNETRCYGWQDNRKMQNMWKVMHAIESRQIEKLLSCYLAEANLDGSRICLGSIGLTKSFLMDLESIEKLSRQSPESLMDRVCVNFCQDKKKKGLNR